MFFLLSIILDCIVLGLLWLYKVCSLLKVSNKYIICPTFHCRLSQLTSIFFNCKPVMICRTIQTVFLFKTVVKIFLMNGLIRPQIVLSCTRQWLVFIVGIEERTSRLYIATRYVHLSENVSEASYQNKYAYVPVIE